MKLDNATFSYHRGRPVILGVTAQVQPGKLLALLGPNGCGKTTLLKLMLGEFLLHSGGVTLDDQPVHRLDPARRAALISYVPQRSAVAFAFTVRQVVEMSRFALPPDDAAVEDAIVRCDLKELQSQPFVELSVGQQQRVLLARAVAQSRGGGRCMLLDEPTSGMDLLHAHQTMHQLRGLAATGLAVVVVVQELNLAARYADEAWLMQHGRIVASGEWSQVLRPQVLEPVYGVSLTPLATADERPVFDAKLPLPAAAG